MVFAKGNSSGFLSKGFGDKLLGGAKGVAGFLDNGLVQSAITALAPEIGMGITAASKAGLLQKIKNA